MYVRAPRTVILEGLKGMKVVVESDQWSLTTKWPYDTKWPMSIGYFTRNTGQFGMSRRYDQACRVTLVTVVFTKRYKMVRFRKHESSNRGNSLRICLMLRISPFQIREIMSQSWSDPRARILFSWFSWWLFRQFLFITFFSKVHFVPDHYSDK